jgi:hypothetical protein
VVTLNTRDEWLPQGLCSQLRCKTLKHRWQRRVGNRNTPTEQIMSVLPHKRQKNRPHHKGGWGQQDEKYRLPSTGIRSSGQSLHQRGSVDSAFPPCDHDGRNRPHGWNEGRRLVRAAESVAEIAYRLASCKTNLAVTKKGSAPRGLSLMATTYFDEVGYVSVHPPKRT